MIIDGRKIAGRIVGDLKKIKQPQKTLAVVLVGNNAQSESFIKQKQKIAVELGIGFDLIKLPAETSEENLIGAIEKLNKDNSVGGIILQLPLPENLNKDNVIPSISPLKDIDALTEEARKNNVNSLAVETVKDILSDLNIDIKDKIVAVVGRGFLVGRPILDYFSDKCLKMITLNSQSDINLIKEADIVISGTGKVGLIKPELLKENAVVIDFGYGLDNEGKLKGDFDSSHFENCKLKIENLIKYTPTPGGTGPILVAEIFKNFYKLNG